jgi:LysR family nitrogen assimilation transcriptional regulator
MKLSSLTVKQLRYFARVVEAGSISGAAETLHVAQTAIGVQIRALEDQLGTPLLQRNCRGVATTPAGRFVYARAVAIVAAVDGLPDEVAPLAGAAAREVSLGLSPGPMARIGAEVLMQAREDLPEVALTLVEAPRERLVAALRDGALDYAIAHEADGDDAIAAVPLLRQRMVLATRPDRGLPPGPVRLADALAFDLAARGDTSHLMELVARKAAGQGLAPRIAYRVDSPTVLKVVIRDCDAAAILTADLVAAEAASGALAVHPIVAPELPVTLHFATRRTAPPGPVDAPLLGLLDGLLDRVEPGAGPPRRSLATLADAAH